MTDDEKDKTEVRLRELLAKSLVNIPELDLRNILTDLLRERLMSYDCARLIEAAIAPELKDIIAEIVKEPEVIATLTAKARNAALLMGVKCVEPSRY